VGELPMAPALRVHARPALHPRRPAPRLHGCVWRHQSRRPARGHPPRSLRLAVGASPSLPRGNLVRDPWTADSCRATSSSFANIPAGRGNTLDSRKAIAPSWSRPLTPEAGGILLVPAHAGNLPPSTTQYTRVWVRQATQNQQTLTRNPAKGEQVS
jgi:hypothetical protein